MLNPFPIQFLSLFAYFLLRLFVGSVLIYLGISHFKYRNELKNVLTLSWFPYGMYTAYTLAIGEFVIGSLLVAGAYTQYAALALMVMSLKMLVMRNWFAHHTIPPKMVYLLLFATSLSLFITGAGVLAFDLPF